MLSDARLIATSGLKGLTLAVLLSSLYAGPMKPSGGNRRDGISGRAAERGLPATAPEIRYLPSGRGCRVKSDPRRWLSLRPPLGGERKSSPRPTEDRSRSRPETVAPWSRQDDVVRSLPICSCRPALLMIESFIEHAVVEWPHEIRRCRERIALLSGIAGSAKIIPGWALRLNPDQ
jgi:hypothetical protein